MKAPVFKVDPQCPEEEKIRIISKMLLNGGILIIPTETVYGVAADVRNHSALKRLYEIKQRPLDKPFSLLINNKEYIEDVAVGLNQIAYKLIDAFWPGPMTIVVKNENNQTIGLRVPDHAIARSLLASIGGPLYCPSANISGKAAPVDLDAAMQDLGDKVDGAIDAGKARIGIESSVIDVSGPTYNILREGALQRQQIKDVAEKKIVLFICTGNSCRSVMAKAYLEKRLKELGRSDICVLSAGVLGLSNLRATTETKEVLKKEDIDVDSHRSTKVDSFMVKKSDFILVMERAHERAILDIAPIAQTRLFLLKEFAKIKDGSLDIFDPIGKSLEFYEYTFSIIKEAINKIVELI